MSAKLLIAFVSWFRSASGLCPNNHRTHAVPAAFVLTIDRCEALPKMLQTSWAAPPWARASAGVEHMLRSLQQARGHTAANKIICSSEHNLWQANRHSPLAAGMVMRESLGVRYTGGSWGSLATTHLPRPPFDPGSGVPARSCLLRARAADAIRGCCCQGRVLVVWAPLRPPPAGAPSSMGSTPLEATGQATEDRRSANLKTASNRKSKQTKLHCIHTPQPANMAVRPTVGTLEVQLLHAKDIKDVELVGASPVTHGIADLQKCFHQSSQS